MSEIATSAPTADEIRTAARACLADWLAHVQAVARLEAADAALDADPDDEGPALDEYGQARAAEDAACNRSNDSQETLSRLLRAAGLESVALGGYVLRPSEEDEDDELIQVVEPGRWLCFA